jgi:hypothetical protein
VVTLPSFSVDDTRRILCLVLVRPLRAQTLVVFPIRARLGIGDHGEQRTPMTGKKPKDKKPREQMRKGKGIQPTTAQGPPPKITPETANPTPWSPKESEKG